MSAQMHALQRVADRLELLLAMTYVPMPLAVHFKELAQALAFLAADIRAAIDASETA